MTPTPEPKAWAACPECKGNPQGKPVGFHQEKSSSGLSHTVLDCVPCPTCAAHFAAVAKAVAAERGKLLAKIVSNADKRWRASNSDDEYTVAESYFDAVEAARSAAKGAA